MDWITPSKFVIYLSISICYIMIVSINVMNVFNISINTTQSDINNNHTEYDHDHKISWHQLIDIYNYSPTPYFNVWQVAEQQNFGDIIYEPMSMCCAMPTLWSRQSAWKIYLEQYLYKCDHIFFFIDSTNDPLSENRINIGDIGTEHYKPFNPRRKHSNLSFEWLYDPYLADPTLYHSTSEYLDKKREQTKLHNFAYINVLSPFPIPNDKEYWIIPLNKFINHTLLNPNKDYWVKNKRNVSMYSKINFWDKVSSMFTYLYLYHLSECQWIIKIEDDSVLNVDSTRAFLSFYNYLNPHYLGVPETRRLGQNKGGVVSNNGMYVLSQDALEQVVSKKLLKLDFIDNKRELIECVRSNQINEDALLGVCLRDVGIVAEYTQTSKGQSRKPFRLSFRNMKDVDTFKEWKDWIDTYRSNDKYHYKLEYHGTKIAYSENITVFQDVVKYIVHNMIDKYNPDWNNITIRKQWIELHHKSCPFVCDFEGDPNGDASKIYIQKALNSTS